MCKYIFLGTMLRLARYEIIIVDEQEEKVALAISDEEKEEIITQYPNAVVKEVDNTDYEWLDGMVFTQEQLKAGELEKAIELGQDAYMALKNAPTQDEINAMLMLQIAELKAGGANE